MSSRRAMALAFLLGAPFMLPALGVGCLRQDWGSVTASGWGGLGFMIVFATLVCYPLHLFALARLTAGQVAVFTDLVPAIATAVAVLAGYDRLTWPLVAGGLVTLVGVALVQAQPRGRA
jgi:drug/metabolite transporter (DMT)-like permease